MNLSLIHSIKHFAFIFILIRIDSFHFFHVLHFLWSMNESKCLQRSISSVSSYRVEAWEAAEARERMDCPEIIFLFPWLIMYVCTENCNKHNGIYCSTNNKSNSTTEKWLVWIDGKSFPNNNGRDTSVDSCIARTSNKMDGVRESAWKNLVLGRTMYS